MDDWLVMQESATLPLMAGRFAAWARRARDPRVARVEEGRQTAITSTTRAREPRAGIPQVIGVMRIDLSFLLRSDNSTASMAHRVRSFQRGFATAPDT